MSSLKEKLASLPLKPGVYLFKDKSGTIIYIGKAKSLRKRVASYFRPNPTIKTSVLLDRLYDIDYIQTSTELDALILEDELVKKYKPRYNITLKDDKAYPYLKLTVNEEWPRLYLVRRKEDDGALYFGRYQGGMVRAVIRLIKKLFPIRWCAESPLRKREQPCLFYRTGSCSGPCIGKISQPEYRALVQGIILFLEGKAGQAINKMKEEMEKAAAERNFERAAYLRDRIRLLEKMMEGKTDLVRAPSPRLLAQVTELQKELKMGKPPMRIEAFDISNIQGSNIVASMVTFFGGVPLKNEYRRFKINSVKGEPNDVKSIYEVVARRYGGSLSKKMDPPDLLLIDGGLAQVNSAQRALEEAGLDRPIIGLAKREEEIFFPGRARPLRLGRRSPALQLLQKIRDEAHRFAVSFHRQRRARALFG
jgi:excinuclease ABC subunit C